MVTEKQLLRRQKVQASAYALLEENGYKATSMLAIAKHAGVSNETLYRWYENKQALFADLVTSNAQQALEWLDSAQTNAQNPIETLELLGPILLELVTSDRAISLNRAAASDVFESNTLGSIIAKFGRKTVAPRITALIEQADRQALISCPDAKQGAEIYIALLIGDMQIGRVIGVRDNPSAPEIAAQTTRANTLFMQLFAVKP